ncbi:MAG TPA: GNAT family N-acetyltransferase [Clostridiaceae bacterium]|nr:GNAT family N-acetyltransferase [Clostridiaceae bacterium]
MVQIVPVRNKRQLDTFITFPFKLYKNNPYWVPPLISDEKFTFDKKKNPAFEFSDAELWLAYKDGKVAGRIAGIISYSYIKKWGNKYARFGWIDFIDDPDVSKALLETVEEWAKKNGMDGIHGPLGFCDLDKEGMLVEGFEEMGTFITIYNSPYYMNHMEALGYVKDAEWIELEITVPDNDIAEKISALSQRAKEKYGLSVVPLKKSKDVLPYAKEIFDLLNKGYEHLYGVVPITPKQVDGYVKQFFSYVNVDYICIVKDKDGRIAGFGIIMPSLTRAAQKSRGRLFPTGFIHFLNAIRKNDTLDLYLVAIRPELRSKGVPYIMLDELTKSALKNGVVKAIASPELETNHAVQSMWRSYETRIHRRRRCYIKLFNNSAEDSTEPGES